LNEALVLYLSEFGLMVGDLTELATRLIKEFYSSQQEILHFHNLDHALEVSKAATEIARGESLDESEYKYIEIASLFHDTGYFEGAAGHEARSAEILKELMGSYLSPEEIKHTQRLILATDHSKRPDALSEQILCDADLSYLGTDAYHSRSQLLRIELREFRGREFSDLEWIEFNLNFFKSHEFYTPTAQELYGAKKSVHQKELEVKLGQ
jgi:predicted metal-dependent HD superfamily phosphohydrolase